MGSNNIQFNLFQFDLYSTGSQKQSAQGVLFCKIKTVVLNQVNLIIVVELSAHIIRSHASALFFV